MPTSGDVVKADAAELAALSKSAAAAGRQVEDVARRAGAIIGGLDGRGWNLGAVQAGWSAARGQFTQLMVDLSAMAIDLADRATLVVLFETGPGFGMAPGEKLPGYAGKNLAALDAILFPPHGITEKKYSKELDWLLGGKPTAQRLAKLKGTLPDVLLPTAAAMAERARQIALHGSPAGIRRKINALDKLDPTASYQLNLMDANAVVYGLSVGGKNASFSAEILAAHAHASAGLSLDIQRRRFSANFDIGAEANLIDAHAQAAERIGNSLLGGGADVLGDAAVGANADARIGLTMDALKGKLTGDVGGDAFAGASASAQGSLEA